MDIYPPIRIIPFYLPQFHPVPENDEWWEKGFTEWTNTAKAAPLYRGHYQPNIPADLGFYDLRLPEARIAQAELAQSYGIEGFCYWHYWFAGKRILEKPFNEVLESGVPNFPFCLAWANQSWTGIWHGCPDRILIEQTYPGINDYENHFYAILDALVDDRYIRIDGKPAFIIYNIKELPESRRFIDLWQELAIRSGLPGIHFIGLREGRIIPEEYGFDASTPHNPGEACAKLSTPRNTLIERISRKLFKKNVEQLRNQIFYHGIKFYTYKDYIKEELHVIPYDTLYPCIVPNWDNTPRSGYYGRVLHNSVPELFRSHLRHAMSQIAHRPYDKRLIFIKSWNEWAEGNYLEPDIRFGKAYLQVVAEELRYSYQQLPKINDAKASVVTIRQGESRV